jgi:hypothetical protein
MHAPALHAVPSALQARPQAPACLRRLFSDQRRSRSRLRMAATASSSNGAPSGRERFPCMLLLCLEGILASMGNPPRCAEHL